jgi:predicted dehydrogenase
MVADQSTKRRYVVCGLSNRAINTYVRPLLPPNGDEGRGNYADEAELVGILDIDERRVREFLAREQVEVPVFLPESFDTMIDETKPDTVIVVGPDGTHAEYIVKGLRRDLDVITEKPMVVDSAQASAVLEAERASSGSVRVTHNSRYREPHQVMRRLIMDGKIGRVTNVEFVHNLDTYHGASYYWRWNRYREMSGGLTITKAVHHFDLINWLIDDVPDQVFAFGALNYYGPRGAHNPNLIDGRDYSPAGQKARCPYNRRWSSDDVRDDHLGRDKVPFYVQYGEDSQMYIYDDDITIEDTYSAVVRYRGGPSMSYSLNLSTPWEGYVLAINGTEGRIETTSFTAPSRVPFPVPEGQRITYLPLFGEPETIEVKPLTGSHDGSDGLLTNDLFRRSCRAEPDPLRIRATSTEGAYAVAIGEAMWRSVESGAPISISSLMAGQ